MESASESKRPSNLACWRVYNKALLFSSGVSSLEVINPRRVLKKFFGSDSVI